MPFDGRSILTGARPNQPQRHDRARPPNLSRPGLKRPTPMNGALHHVVPYNQIRAFAQKALESEDESLNRLLRVSVDHMMANSPEIGGVRMQGASTLEDLYDQIDDPEKFDAQHWEAIESALTWMPGNLFHGPEGALRSHDPGEGFDREAEHVLGTRHYNALERANTHIQSFLDAAERRDMESALRYSSDVVTRFEMAGNHAPRSYGAPVFAPYEEEQWEGEGNRRDVRYHVRPRSGRR